MRNDYRNDPKLGMNVWVNTSSLNFLFFILANMITDLCPLYRGLSVSMIDGLVMSPSKFLMFLK